MAKRPQPKTIDDMVIDALERSGLGLTAWCAKNKLNPRLVYRWRFEEIDRPQLAKVIAFAKAVGQKTAAVQAALEKRIRH